MAFVGFRPTRILGAVFLAVTAPLLADAKPTLSFGGVTGLIDMPTGESQSDGAFSVTSSHFGPISRTTLSFQITPRLSGSFRYTAIRKWDVPGSKLPTNYDRSFDLRYQVFEEGNYTPGVVVGLQDIIGTGVMSGEYVAATKSFGDRFKVTAGLGWGRFGSYGAIGAPFGDRPPVDVGKGGNIRTGQWFKGDVAPFAGVEWLVNDKLSLKAEYSSDDYTLEAGKKGTFERKSPFNFGVEYQLNRSIRLGGYYLYGSELGFSAQIVLDPKTRPTGGILGAGPVPIVSRPGSAAGWSQQWVSDTATVPSLRGDLQKRLRADGIVLESLAVTATTVQIRIRNTKLDNGAQAIGRTARALAASLPASVETFTIVPVDHGIPLSEVVLRRSDLEELDHAGGQDALIRARTLILPAESGLPEGTVLSQGLYPAFSWNVAPYVKASLFDPQNPLRADFGLRLSGKYDIAPGLVLSGAVTKKLAGNLDKSQRDSNSILPHVRSDSNKYDANGDPAIENLTLAWYAKPAPNLYSRVTLGYLEPMFGGISGELLWKRVDRPYALGVELNYVQQRNFDQLFGFKDYSVVTGHMSGYYDFGNGFQAQLDIGRYLAGDYGATLTIDREFPNGWKVGAFATLTDVSFDDFGEGSFDKGIRIEIPFAWALGRPTQKTTGLVVRPILRDGGARLNVDGRLYDFVRDYHSDRLDDKWGRFWR